MKTIKNLFMALLFLAPTLVFCQKTIQAESLQQIQKPTFNVVLNTLDCYIEGKSVQTKIISFVERRRVRYTFLWEVDGVPYGHTPSIECVTGKMATVHVTQYPSGLRVTKSIKLPNRIDNN